MSTAISKALDLAMTHHAGQTDKAGRPYIEHVLRVALAQTDPLRTVVALLHDLVEDTEVSIGHIQLVFGHDVAVVPHFEIFWRLTAGFRPPNPCYA